MAQRHKHQLKYGAQWVATDSVADQLAIELECIRNLGKWTWRGRSCGNGLSFHVKAAIKLLWPEMQWHRWCDLMCDEFCRGGRLAIFGPSSSWKSYVISRCAQVIFYAFPGVEDVEQSGCTCIISSTTLAGLHKRVWDYVVSGHRAAKKRFPMLPGSLIESKTMLLADDKDTDGRSYKNGIIGVACRKGGQWQGLEEYVGIKNKVFILLADECFPAGTLVQTHTGLMPIEHIRRGDLVKAATGYERVLWARKTKATQLVRITTCDGRSIDCTPEHPFFTQFGWKKACELNQTHYMLSADEAMQHVWSDTQAIANPVLRKCLLSEVDTQSRTGRALFEHLETGASEESEVAREIVEAHVGQKSANAQFEIACENATHFACDGSQAEGAWRQRHWSNESRAIAFGDLPRSKAQLQHSHIQGSGQWLPRSLQGGRGVARAEAGRRGRRLLLWLAGEADARCQKDAPAYGAWVDRVEVLQQADYAELASGAGGVDVYNLQVAGHPSYSVGGLLAHNCHFMPMGFLDALANLDSNGIVFSAMMGNLPNIHNPLGRAAEPKLGWETLPDTEKSRVYDTRWFNGRCVQLIGTDSPNLDFPEGQEPYPRLIGRAYIDMMAHNYGRESDKFNMFASGKVPKGSLDRTVFTKSQCLKFNAMSQVTWGHKPFVRGYCLDAAYSGVGGDRTPGAPFIFGIDNTGRWRFLLGNITIYRGSADTTVQSHSEAIALQCKSECEQLGIPPEHVFYDGTGRSELTSAFARLWSAAVNAIEFGGAATDRPSFTGERWLEDGRGEKRAGDVKLCRDVFDRFVSELWFAIRHCILADQMRGLTEELIDESCQRRWELVRGAKYSVEPKDGERDGQPVGMKARGLRSPDLGDMLCCGLEGARRLGFPLGKHTPLEKRHSTDRWLRSMSDAQWERAERTTLKAA